MGLAETKAPLKLAGFNVLTPKTVDLLTRVNVACLLLTDVTLNLRSVLSFYFSCISYCHKLQ